MINRVVLVGRLTRDPELRYTQSNIAVANIRIAVDRPFSNQSGQTDSDYFDIIAWNKQAQAAANNLVKGQAIAVDGRMQLRQWTDNNTGQNRSKVEVVGERIKFLQKPNNGGHNGNNGNGGGDLPDDDDIPF